MKKLVVIFWSVLFSTSLLAQTISDAEAETRPVTSFHAIRISNSFDLYLTQGDEEALAVSAAKEKYKQRITTTVKDGVLIIGYDNEGWKGESNKKLKAYVSFKMIDKLQVSGACDVYVNGAIKVNDLDLIVTGASDVKRAEIHANRLYVDLHGASDIYLTGGKVTSLKVECRGASDFHGYDLQTETCEAEAHGASDIRITVTKELSARATGASGIMYKGDGVIRELKSSGASSVSKRG